MNQETPGQEGAPSGLSHVYFGLGSNIGDRLTHLQQAIERLSRDVRIDEISSVWDTAPELVEDQPRFLNAAVAGWTRHDPVTLLRIVKRVESEMGRQPGLRYGPREIDIDILLFDNLVYASRDLQIPHPLLQTRAFVLAPLAEIAPDARHPELELSIADLAARLPQADIRRVGALSPPGHIMPPV